MSRKFGKYFISQEDKIENERNGDIYGVLVNSENKET